MTSGFPMINRAKCLNLYWYTIVFFKMRAFLVHNMVACKCLPDKAMRWWRNSVEIWGKMIPPRGTSKCKISHAWTCLVALRNMESTSVGREQWGRERAVDTNVRVGKQQDIAWILESHQHEKSLGDSEQRVGYFLFNELTLAATLTIDEGMQKHKKGKHVSYFSHGGQYKVKDYTTPVAEEAIRSG